MTSLLQWALTGAGGICIVLALKHVFVDYRASRDRIHLALGAAALAVAAYEYAALGVYRSTSIDGYVSAVRIHVAAAALAYLTLVWLSALQTRAVPRWLLWTATVTSAVIVVWNVLSPQTLLFAGVIEVQGVLLPWGEVIVQGVAIPSEWSHVGELLAFSLYGVCAYAWWGYSDDGESGTALPVATGGCRSAGGPDAPRRRIGPVRVTAGPGFRRRPQGHVRDRTLVAEYPPADQGGEEQLESQEGKLECQHLGPRTLGHHGLGPPDPLTGNVEHPGDD